MNKSILFVLLLSLLLFPLSYSEGILPHDPSDHDSAKVIEKVYLHVDRDRYYPGDDIWFKAYLIDASDMILSSNSMNLHVELISPEFKIVDSRVVKLENGMGNGDFHLEEKLASGEYTLRAYTNYMRNFGSQLFFNKIITVINSTDADKAFSDTLNYSPTKLVVRFFPEGGSLVENVTSVVAFKAEDENGNSHDITGEILSSQGERVVGFNCIHNGMGTFLLKPLTGVSYYAKTRDLNGDSARYELPESFSSGFVMNVSKNRDRHLLLTFRTNAEMLRNIPDSDFTLTVSSHNEVYKTFSFRMKSLNNILNLSTDDLPEGIIALTLSGTKNAPLCERLVYITHNEDIKINIETDKKVYNQRDSVLVRISLQESSALPVDGNLSLSATDNFFRDNSYAYPSTISSWFLLESDIRGPVEDPSYYFDRSNPSRLEDLDLLLLTQGWRDFKWKQKSMEYLPEYGFTISGRVRKKIIDLPVKDATVNIGIFNNGKPWIRNLPVDAMGRFSITGLDFSGRARLIASVTGDMDDLKGWLLLDSLNYIPAVITGGLVRTKFIRNEKESISTGQILNDNQLLRKDLHTYIHYSEIRNAIQKKYKLSDTIKLGEVSIIEHKADWTDSPAARSRHYLMGTPDYEVKITPLEKGYATAYKLISVRYLSQVNLPSWLYNPKIRAPLYMINGRIAEMNEIKALPIDWVERIDVVKNSASMLALRAMVEYEIKNKMGLDSTAYGYADGAVSIILKEGADEKRSYHSTSVIFSGYNEPRIFYSPVHRKTLENDFKPDLRTTLFWEPDIRVQSGKDLFLKYFNADNSSIVRIEAEGITSSGVPVACYTEYEVK
jgi:MG2 domain